MTEPTPAGWYPDPENSGQQRYWDGNAWTQNFAPVNAPATPVAAVAKKPFYKRTWFIVVAVLIGLAAIGSMIDGSPSEAPESRPSATESAPPPTETEEAPAAAEPAPAPEPIEEPAEPEMTMGQEQAVLSAQGYVDMGGFSRQKLIDQLLYEGFSKAEAEYGAKAVGY